ncbi:MAG: hypothetical protein ACLR8Y_18150 [Alistipes indistinctus]
MVVAPITSGGFGLRSARLIAADFLHLEQRAIRRRLYISIPLFVVGFAITLMNFGVIWQYFAWVNQTLAAVTLWTITGLSGQSGIRIFGSPCCRRSL